MRFTLRLLLGLLLLVGISAAAYNPIYRAWTKRFQPRYREVEVTRGTITEVINATGEVQPILSVKIGAVISGPIIALYADFNDAVMENQLLARIDPRISEAAVARDEAALETRHAEVDRANALLQQAKNQGKRAIDLQKVNPDFISDNEMDQIVFNKKSLEAQLAVAKAAVKQAEAQFKNSQTNLTYTYITSPVDGIVIDRKIDEGQSLASSFQTPELFVVAPEMRSRMHIFASVDEADIGYIRSAQERDQPVQFTVDTYPDDLFEGRIAEIRLGSTTTQNVVTYPVVIEAPNPELKLLPGMTANLTFQIEKKEDVLRIPNSAFWFYPKISQVRKEDRELLEGKQREEEEKEGQVDRLTSAEQRQETKRKRRTRHVWVVEDDKLKAVEIEMGLIESRYTELVKGDLSDGQKLVIGLKSRLSKD